MAAPVTADSGHAMAGPSNPSRQSIATPGGQAAEKRPPQSKMTKAERRALQERQREKKAMESAAKGQNGKGGVKAKAEDKAAGGGVAQSRGRRGTVSGDAPPSSAGRARDPRDSIHGEDIDGTRGLRIFSHFGQPKPPSNVKGDIHPAIISLGLQFSSFKITGANARCIATLSTFKTVGTVYDLAVQMLTSL